MISESKFGEVKLATFENTWYKPGNSLKKLLWIFCNTLFFNNGFAIFNGFKIFILRIFGATIGKNVLIKPSVNIKYPWFLTIGDDSWIGENVWLDNLAIVKIGSNVCISQGAMLLTGNHSYNKQSFDLLIGEIIIEDGSWIGAKSIICPGVHCGTHSVLTVHSVATKNLHPYTIYQGNPAVAIKERIIL